MLFAATAANEFVTVSASGGGKYVCRVDGVDVSSHTSEYKAASQANNLKLANPNSTVICEQHRSLVATLTSAGRSLLEDAGASVIVVEPPPSGGSVVDLGGMTTYSGTTPAWDTTAYDALDVPSMSDGDSYVDPAGGLTVYKLTDSNTPGTNTGGFHTIYSGSGLQISQAWGENSDQYTILFHNPLSPAFLVDYQLGGTITNYRSAPSTEGKQFFARSAGNEQIMYVNTGSQLRRYDTSTDSYDDTGDFPYTWSTNGFWLQGNNDDSWFIATVSGGFTALEAATGTVITETGLSSPDEPYMGYGNVAYLVAIGNNSHWDLDADTTTALALPSGFSPIFHSGGMKNGAHHLDTNQRPWRIDRINENNTVEGLGVDIGVSWDDMHMSTHWWDTPPGFNDQVLASNDGTVGGGGADADMQSAVFLIDSVTGDKRFIAHHYSIYGAGPFGNYYDATHATISNDGVIVLMSSNMNGENRHDVFLIELPRTNQVFLFIVLMTTGRTRRVYH